MYKKSLTLIELIVVSVIILLIIEPTTISISFIIFIIFVLVTFTSVTIFIKSKFPSWIGQSGENFVSEELHQLDITYYRTLDDLMLPSNGNSSFTQIDHVVVSNFGIFCIETKSYKGWVFGNVNQKYWTQVIYRFRNRFYNPLFQNFAHIKAIENLLGLRRLKLPIVSLVVFPRADRLKISGTDSVGGIDDIMRKIGNYTTIIYTDFERNEIFNLLSSANIFDEGVRKLHSKEVKELR